MLRGHQPLARLSLVVALLLIGGTGCSYIGQSAFEEKRASLDHDGDGAPFDGPNQDCDDFNDKRTPGAEEIPYDGFDNDCDGADVVDADQDGYPGITKATYLALNPDAVWPDSVIEGPLDCADDPVAQPFAANVFPGNPNEVPYDGVDADCGQDNDFDRDGDGFMPDTITLGAETIDVAAAYNAYVQEWGLDLGTPQYGDCNDLDSGISPAMSAADDIWYDGKDTNCDGANDFDADGDGYMFDQDTYEQDYIDFLQLYHGGTVPSDWIVPEWGDCLDQVNPVLPASPGPADVNPGVTYDEPYDGIDANCLADNDFDGDGDGYMPDIASSGAFDTYVADWGYQSLVPQYGDCDDTNPLIYTGALEAFGDSLDSDCDGVDDGTPFGFNGYIWDSPRPPRVDGAAGRYILVTSANAATTSGLESFQTGHSLYFDNTAGYDAIPLGLAGQWLQATTTFPMGQAVDIQMTIDGSTGDPIGWASSTSFNGITSTNTVYSRSFDFLAVTGGFTPTALNYSPVSDTGECLAVDMVLDGADRPWVVSCSDTAVHATRTLEDGTAILSDSLPAISTGVCFWNGMPNAASELGELVVCDPGVSCEQYDFNPTGSGLSLSAVNDWSGETLTYGQYREGWHHLIHTGQPGGELRTPTQSYVLMEDLTLDSLDADWRDTDGDGITETVYAIGVGTPLAGGSALVLLSYGDPSTGNMTEVVLPFEDPTRPSLVPASASIHTDTARMFIAVSASNPSDGSDEAIGWAFFGW